MTWVRYRAAAGHATKTPLNWLPWVVALCCLVVCGCGDSGAMTREVSEASDTEGAVRSELDSSSAQTAAITDASREPAEECVSSRRPIIAAHGFLASGDTWATQAQRFIANGYCRQDIVAFDWNTVSDGRGPMDMSLERLDEAIDRVLADTNSEQVDLIGHSAGGSLCYAYLSLGGRAAKVAHYAHIGSTVQSGPAGQAAEVPTLNIWSEEDMAISDKGDIEGATNLKQGTADHYSVATNIETFMALYSFFNEGEAPMLTVPSPSDAPTLHGRVVAFGENTPMTGDISVYATDPQTGTRAGAPILDEAIGGEGAWGPLSIDSDTRYEFVVSEKGNRPVHYYYESFTTDDPLVYLRGFPGEGSIIGLLLGVLSFDDRRASMVVFSSTRTLIHGKDSLTIDGAEILNPSTAPKEESAIAFFLFDSDEDGESSFESIALFESFPFLVGVDVALRVEPNVSFTVELNGRPIIVPAWPSDSEGATVLVYN